MSDEWIPQIDSVRAALYKHWIIDRTLDERVEAIREFVECKRLLRENPNKGDFEALGDKVSLYVELIEVFTPMVIAETLLEALDKRK
jgi:hypothetical protein